MILPRLTSLRARLLLGVIAGLVVLQVASSIVVYALQRRALYKRFDQALVTTAKALSPQVKYDKSKGVHFDMEEMDEAPVSEFQRPKGPDYFQVWRSDGSVVARSQTLGEANLPIVPSAQRPVAYDCPLPRGEAGRAVQMTIELQQKGPPERRTPPQIVTLVVAREIEAVLNDLWTLGWILAGTSLASVLVAGGLALAVVTHGLRPLGRVTRQIADVGPSDLGARIDPAGLPAELQPVAQRLNEMLARLQTAFDRERGFTADAAHEFRNPIAAIRSTGEVALASPQTPDEYRQDIAQMVALAAGMQGMVEKLLVLARLDAGLVPLNLASVALNEVVAPAVAALGQSLESSAVSLDCRIGTGLAAVADRDLLGLVVKNALDNAAEYVDAGGRITVEGSNSGSAVVLTVTNTGCRLAPEQASCVFERFWRADPARSAAGAHAGLGLSLVARAVAMMGGTAQAIVRDGRFTLRIQLRA